MALPEPEGVGTALRLSYLRSEPTCGAAPIEGIIMSGSSCRNWSFPDRRASTLSGVGVPGIDCGADLVGQTCSASSTENYCMTSESQTHSAPLPATPLTTLQRASQGPMQPTCSGHIGLKTVN